MLAFSSAAAPAVRYRPDIDGLRAFAVLAVIGFHAFPTWVPGGFVGVDVFFVISGYLISQQLFTACDRRAFSIRDFYIRRVRRILPALILVLIATAVFGWFALTPTEFQGLQSHLAASAFFSNNFLLWSESGYFDEPAKAKPLLHLWSLGVEEQFYIVWPWLIYWGWRRGLQRTTLIGLIAITSLIVSTAMIDNGNTTAAYYLPHSRLWQLAAGAWLAAISMGDADGPGLAAARRLFIAPTSRDVAWMQGAFALAGTVMIGVAIIALGQGGQPSWWTDGGNATVTGVVRYLQRQLGASAQGLAYPGWPALLPTVGAALIVAAGPATFFNRVLLGARVPVFIGLISYPLYLWHWPILSFLSITERGRPARPVLLGALALSLVLATLSYVLIEKPIRARIGPANTRRAGALALGLAGIGVIMIAALVTGRLLPPVRVAGGGDVQVPYALNDKACRAATGMQAGYCQQYLDSSAPITTVLFGDSHAAHLFPGLGARLSEHGQNLLHVGDMGCPPLMHIERAYEKGGSTCAEINSAALNMINNSTSLEHVVLAFRGGIYTAGDVAGATLVRLAGTTIVGRPAVETALTQTVESLLAHHKRLTIVLPTPTLGFEISDCVGRPLSFAPQHIRTPCAVAQAEVLRDQAADRAIVLAQAQRFPINVVDSLPALCDGERCWGVIDGQPLYSDNNHLGIAGSKRVARVFALSAR
jgi:peptidoglycan/LPS O-acetylase OafA/YrhL